MEARRRRPDSEDRRGIPRFTDNEFNSLLLVEAKILRFLMVVSVLFGVFEFGYSFKDGLEWGTRGIFFLIVFATLGGLSYRRYSCIKLYLENNSLSNLRRSQESLNSFMIYAAVVVTFTLLASAFYRL
jgi:hypothetical protein